MDDIITCPDCGLPAELSEYGVLMHEDGPVRMAKIQCVDRHWFLMEDPR